MIILLLFINIRIELSYHDKKFDMVIRVGGIKLNTDKFLKKPKMNVELKTDKPNDEKNSEKEAESKLSTLMSVLTAFGESASKIRKTIIVENLNLKAVYGSEDAAVTGVAVGIAYAEIYKLIAFVACIFTVNQPSIEIKPEFEDTPKFEVDLDGIIKSKPVHIIFTGLKLIKDYRKAQKRKD